jgi:hypothetical protein
VYGDCESDAELKAAWDDFCDQLKGASEVVFRDDAPCSPTTRATGFRYLARNIALALQFELENNDPLRPELMHYFDPVRKQGGDNTDALYVGAPINGEDAFRLHGNRGSARFLAVTVVERGDTPWGGSVAGTLLGPDLKTDAEGNFELFLSPDERGGNWIRTTPESYRVTVRQFFADWEGERPMAASIERLDGIETRPFVPEDLVQGLSAAGEWLRWSTRYWAEKIESWKQRPNQFIAFAEMESSAIDATPGGTPLICYWQVPRDEALIIRVRPPAANYWNCEFGSYWWETMDYRYRLSSTNCHHAVLEEDGMLTVVVSHADPGLPNWLDPSGHDEGYVTFRWIGADSNPRPECTQVPVANLSSALPEGAKKISTKERMAQLEGRRVGAARRFRM